MPDGTAADRIDDDESAWSEERLRDEGVVPPFTLSDVARESPKRGTAPWWPHGRASTLASFRHGCPPLLIGGSAFGKGIFTDTELLQSTEPYRVVRLAFEYGIRAIDTSPFYHPSEISLGRILDALKNEYPRTSYYLQTKVGRYGPSRKDFDYSPERVRRSVTSSLTRLRTTYLDSVVMHDVEFVCDPVGPSQQEGFAARDALDNVKIRQACGFSFEDDGEDQSLATRIHGPGDAKVLAAVQTLFELKDQGVIRHVGIGGYPLPVLLRLSRLIACSPPFRPLDVIVTYCHHTLQSDLLARYAPLFACRPRSASSWQAPTIINASPFSMGLLTDAGPPAWHPAHADLRDACAEASRVLQSHNGSLARTAAHFGLRGGRGSEVNANGARGVSTFSTIIGMNTVEQVHQAIDSYRTMLAGAYIRNDEDDKSAPMTADEVDEHRAAYDEEVKDEQYVIDLLDARNLRHWTWASPPEDE